MGLAEVWRGSANAWECDELGHLNVAGYFAKFNEAVLGFACELNLGHIGYAEAPSVLRPREIHVRFLAEVRPGAPLSIHAGLMDLDEDSVAVFFEMRDGQDQPAATWRARLVHETPETGKRFSWPGRIHSRVAGLRTELPEYALPKGLAAPETGVEPHLDDADRHGLVQTGRGVFQHLECDAGGRIGADRFMGRLSDSVTNFSAAFPEIARQYAQGEALSVSTALLEARWRYQRWPRPGDHFIVRSALAEARPKTRRLIHWFFDPRSRQPWCGVEAVNGMLNLQTRRLEETTPDVLSALQAQAQPDLTP
ncbi:MAG: thioesterase family protein [Maricaulaceae bacterium]